jgi:hypothetical protein
MNPNLRDLAKETKNPGISPDDSLDDALKGEEVILACCEYGVIALDGNTEVNIAPNMYRNTPVQSVVANRGAVLAISGDKLVHLKDGIPVTNRDVRCACKFGRFILDAGANGIYKTFEYEKFSDKRNVIYMGQHQEELLYLRDDSPLIDSLSGGAYFQTIMAQGKFKSHDGQLYIIGGKDHEDCVFRPGETQAYATSGDCTQIVGLTFWGNELYMTNSRKVFDKDHNVIFESKHEIIDICTVPRKLLKTAGLI